MVVTTAMAGLSLRKDPSLSSASATMKSPFPSLALDPNALSRPPITTVGSYPPWLRIVATMEVVVVLPWLPAIATPYFRRINSASISALGMTGICRRLASRISTLSERTADETTTTSAFSTFSAAWPMKVLPPSFSNLSVRGPSFRSEPETL